MSDITKRDPGRWRVKLFGSVEVTTPTGTIVSITGKKTGELLAYLALHASRAHSREKLVDLIWGDSEVGDARTRLRQEILKLRSLLSTEPEIVSPLIVTNDTCQLRNGTEVDAVQFHEACTEANRSTDLGQKRKLYLAAVSLYTSDLLLGFDAAWIAGERVRLSQCYSRARLELADTQRRLKDYGGAEDSLAALRTHDPLSEEYHIAQMRLYADLGQPTNVQRQLHAMETALRDALGVAPTAGTLKLAEELREAAGNRASELSADRLAQNALELAEPSADSLKTQPGFSKQGSELHNSRPIPRRISPRQTFRVPALIMLSTIAFAACLLCWKRIHTVQAGLAAFKDGFELNEPKWIYKYQPRPGEKPNSEGRAILSDPTAFYVAGFIETEKDDTDILTLKVNRFGKLLWADRYSSPEHDCDRAFSLAHDGKDGIFVAGETYVPPHFKDNEGWHLVLLHYNAGGRRLWVRRSPMVARNEGECVQVESDTRGGCFVAGTALNNGSQSALVLHYDAAGNLLWHKTIREGSRTVFSMFATDAGGDLILCGTARLNESNGNANEVWLVARLGFDGNVKWLRMEDGPAHGGANSAASIVLDRGGNVIVSGVFNSNGVLPDTETGLRLAIQKYRPDGARIWQRVVKELGPAVISGGLSVNQIGDVILGGTERSQDGNWGVAWARYDAFGNKSQYNRYKMPARYSSAALKSLSLANDGQTIIFAEVSKTNGADMHLRKAIAMTQCLSDAEVQKHSLFEPSPQSVNVLQGCTSSPLVAITGQTGPTVGSRELIVLTY